MSSTKGGNSVTNWIRWFLIIQRWIQKFFKEGFQRIFWKMESKNIVCMLILPKFCTKLTKTPLPRLGTATDFSHTSKTKYRKFVLSLCQIKNKKNNYFYVKTENDFRFTANDIWLKLMRISKNKPEAVVIKFYVFCPLITFPGCLEKKITRFFKRKFL